MRQSEVSLLTDSVRFSDRPYWEMCRIQCLISAQKASRKKLKLTDIFKLPWDYDTDGPGDYKEIFKQQNLLEKILNNNINNGNDNKDRTEA